MTPRTRLHGIVRAVVLAACALACGCGNKRDRFQWAAKDWAWDHHRDWKEVRATCTEDGHCLVAAEGVRPRALVCHASFGSEPWCELAWNQPNMETP